MNNDQDIETEVRRSLPNKEALKHLYTALIRSYLRTVTAQSKGLSDEKEHDHV